MKLREEAGMLCNLRHDNIIQFVGLLWSPPDFGVAMSLAEHGSLSTVIDTHSVPWTLRVNLFYGYTHILFGNNRV